MKLKLSYVLPCYNVAPYIQKCFDSILNQDFSNDDYEVIFVDDGSTDGTREIIEKIALKYDFVKTFFFDSPSGYAGRPRNKGIEMAVGEYIAFMDPDDYYVEHSIKSVLDLNLGYDIIINSFYIINPEGKLLDSVKLKDKEINRKKMLWGQIMNVCNQRSLFKRDFIIENNIRFYEHVRSQDLIFLYTCFVKQANIKTTNKFITYYLDERVDSVSNVISDRFKVSSIEMLEIMYNLIKDELSPKEVKSVIQEHFIAVYLKCGNQLELKHKNMLEEKEFYKFLKG